MTPTNPQPRTILQKLARKAMSERGLLPDFSASALAEVARIEAPAAGKGDPHNDPLKKDARATCETCSGPRSITMIRRTSINFRSPSRCPAIRIKVLVAIADVDAVIDGLAAIDLHARHNTTSVYTAATIFPMLPEKLSTDITSLGLAADRQAIVVEMVVAADGTVQEPAIYRAWVRNQAKLAYNSVAAWLEGGSPPAAVAAVRGLDENLRLQDKAAQSLKGLRQSARGPDVRNAPGHGPSSKAMKFASWKSKSPIGPRSSSKISWWPPTA